jgi:hypothetical protein
MKRAKIVLTAVALFAVVGGALAFKATRSLRTLYITNAQGQCKSTFFTTLTTAQQFPNQPIATVTSSYSTLPTNAACPLTTWYTIE